MSKRNKVSYIKPADPKFLQQLKAQIGYNSGPSIDTKVYEISNAILHFFMNVLIYNWNEIF